MEPKDTPSKIKVQELEHLMYQVNNNHPRKDLIYKQLLETPLMKTYFPFYDDFREKCRTATYDEGQYASLQLIDQLFALAVKLRDYKEANKLERYQNYTRISLYSQVGKESKN